MKNYPDASNASNMDHLANLDDMGGGMVGYGGMGGGAPAGGAFDFESDAVAGNSGIPGIPPPTQTQTQNQSDKFGEFDF